MDQMRMTENTSPPPEAQAMAELFHLVQSLLPDDQKLECASPETTVSQAVQKMSERNFSQLPVVEGDAVLGVFSFRSLATRMLEMEPDREQIGDMPVDEFIEEWSFVHLSDIWESLLDRMERDNGVLVGNPDHLDGLLTSMDVLSFLHSVARPFVLLGEIELSLRRIITACVSDEEWDACLQNCLGHRYDADDMPVALNEMTFDEYVQIIQNGRNWPLFAGVFGSGDGQRRRTSARIKEAGMLRNVVFHFRRRLDDIERERLAEHRRWLQRKVRAFEAKQHQTTIAPEGPEGPTAEDYRRLLTRIPVPRGQRQLYKALYDAGDRGMTQDELVPALRRQDRYELAGVLGALGTRVNYTPGYGQDKKPAMGMVLRWKRTDDEQWRYWLLPKMRRALEEMDPPWLHEMTP